MDLKNMAGEKKEDSNINHNENKNIWFCLKCGAEIELDFPGREYAGYCSSCERRTVFRRKIIEFDKDNYIINGRLNYKALAEDLICKYHLITFADTEEVYKYEDGIYVPAEPFLKSKIEEILEEEATTRKVNEVIDKIRRSTYTDREKIDNNPNFICVENGILDITNIEKGEIKLLPHTPEIVLLSKLPVDYNPKAKCERILKFISQVIKEEDIPLIQEIVGYTLWKRYDFHKVIIFVGAEESGKSIMLNLIKALLGRENVVCFPFFSKAQLYNKFAYIRDLPSVLTLKKIDILRMLTSDDLIMAKHKYRKPFFFRNFAKLIFWCNRLPKTYDNTDAFFRKSFIIVNFLNKFDEKPHILENITKPQELSGFLNFALEGLARLLKNGKFSTATC